MDNLRRFLFNSDLPYLALEQINFMVDFLKDQPFNIYNTNRSVYYHFNRFGYKVLFVIRRSRGQDPTYTQKMIIYSYNFKKTYEFQTYRKVSGRYTYNAKELLSLNTKEKFQSKYYNMPQFLPSRFSERELRSKYPKFLVDEMFMPKIQTR